jgi:glycosyltransferase involved in cell wall biosynthesis
VLRSTGGPEAARRAVAMTKVSVIVPVFNPGADMDELVDSLLDQTMPHTEREFVFVDDGSTDGTSERLDRLAADHAEVVVEHIPNSGWPGRPRNVGLDLARGEFVFFADNDDWLERDALAALYMVATTERADIVVGKVVGHGGPRRIPHMFKRDRHGLDARDVPLALLTPHKLFRRALLEEHDIRFPEGKRRLEDHLFVVSAYLAAERISLLSSQPIYHWVYRGEARSASRQSASAESHFASLRELLALVESHTEPGKVRDRFYLNWYRSKVLKRVGRVDRQFADAEYRGRFYDLARQLIIDCFPPRLDDKLPYRFRLRARLLRRDDRQSLERLVAFESDLRMDVHVVRARARRQRAFVRIKACLRRNGRPALQIKRRGNRLLWEPPSGIRLEDDERDVTARLKGRAQVSLRSRDDAAEWMLPTTSTMKIPRIRGGNPVIIAEAVLNPAMAAAGMPLPPGRYVVVLTVRLASFSRDAPARVGSKDLTISLSPDGRLVLPGRVRQVVRRLARGTRVLARATREKYRGRRSADQS